MPRSFLFKMKKSQFFTLKKEIRDEWPWWRLVLIGLNMIALVLSAILSWHYLKGGSMAGCDGASSCEQVLSSQWSVIAGRVPVSGLAIGVYLAMLIAGFYAGPATEAPIRRMARAVMLILAGSITGMAVWFTIVQKWIIGEFCPYCMTEHLIGVLMSAIIILLAFRKSGNYPIQQGGQPMVKSGSPAATKHITRPLYIVGLIACGLVMAGILAVSQAEFTPRAVYREGKSPDSLPAITYHDVPMIGSPDAPYIIKMLFDYECPHCQKIHFMLNEAISRYGGKLAFALCPTPLNTQCNPYIPRDVDAFKNSCELAKIGMAVWVGKREAFPAFDKWMFSFESGDKWRPRSPEAARAKAVALLGQAKLDAAQASPWIEQYIQTCVQIYGQTIQSGKGGVPKLIFGSHWVIPEPNNTADLVMILQKSLAVPKP